MRTLLLGIALLAAVLVACGGGEVEQEQLVSELSTSVHVEPEATVRAETEEADTRLWRPGDAKATIFCFSDMGWLDLEVPSGKWTWRFHLLVRGSSVLVEEERCIVHPAKQDPWYPDEYSYAIPSYFVVDIPSEIADATVFIARCTQTYAMSKYSEAEREKAERVCYLAEGLR